jgi:hypothetical protein
MNSGIVVTPVAALLVFAGAVSAVYRNAQAIEVNRPYLKDSFAQKPWIVPIPGTTTTRTKYWLGVRPQREVRHNILFGYPKARPLNRVSGSCMCVR